MLVVALVPAVCAAVFDWQHWLTIVLLVPAIVLAFVLGQVGGRERGWPAPPRSSLRYYVAALTGVATVMAISVPDRYFGLVIVGLGVIIDIADRAQWRRAERSS